MSAKIPEVMLRDVKTGDYVAVKPATFPEVRTVKTFATALEETLEDGGAGERVAGLAPRPVLAELRKLASDLDLEDAEGGGKSFSVFKFQEFVRSLSNVYN